MAKERDIVALQVRLPTDLHAEIRRLADAEDRPLNRTFIRVLRAGLAHYRGEAADDSGRGGEQSND